MSTANGSRASTVSGPGAQPGLPDSPDALCRVAERVGTPLFVYRPEIALHRVEMLRGLFAGDDPISLLYAVKANPHEGLLVPLLPALDGLDVSSEGELRLALELGYAPDQLSFTGPAKTRAALQLAVERQLGAICVESVEELDEVAGLARQSGVRARVRVRINPPEPIVAYAIVIGGRPSPFGVELERMDDVGRVLRDNSDALDYLGPHFFAGAQSTSAAALAVHLDQCLRVTRQLERQHRLGGRSVNLGGGFGVPYLQGKRPLNIEQLAARAKNLFAAHRRELGRSQRLVFELGRYLVAPAGVFITTVRRTKLSRGKRFVLLDGGIHCFWTASDHWSRSDDHYRVQNLDNADGEQQQVQLAGPLCTPADSMGSDVVLSEPRPGDRLAFLNAGAYGPSASPGAFISQPRPAEIVLGR